MPPKICLNMIVRNEADRIIRALDSCLGHISTYCILDTGSTDGTRLLIRDWADKHGITGSIFYGEFKNFSQARNDALRHGRRWSLHKECPYFDYFLLMDADMELVMPVPNAFDNLMLPAYHMKQRAGTISYDNTRLVSLACSDAAYIGATHEYLNVPGETGQIGDEYAYFVDHADGSNRKDKFERDIRLLHGELKTKPNDPRTWFYLANSLRDAGRLEEAIGAFEHRVSLGDWDEEQWHAQHDIALCHKALGREEQFVDNMLKAINMRPQRGEAFHHLAKHFREKSMHKTAWLFIDLGMKRPPDKLFVADWVYDWGFKEEAAICGFYQPGTKQDGFRAADELLLDWRTPPGPRALALQNIAWYLPKLKDVAPSTEISEINFLADKGFTPMNPSICARPDGTLELILRTVNYTINERGQYMIGEQGCNDAPIETENWLLELDYQLTVTDLHKIQWDRPPALFPQVMGLEDMRLFWRSGERHFSATVREQSAYGQCEMWFGILRLNHDDDRMHVRDAHYISDPAKTEKNWMPVKTGTHVPQRWMYNATTVVNAAGDRKKSESRLRLDDLRGSSQLVSFGEAYLAVTHEAIYRDGKRAYMHRFVWFRQDLSVRRVSMPFVFEECQIEFCAGLALHPHGNKVVLSFGSRDAAAKLAVVGIDDILHLMETGHEG